MLRIARRALPLVFAFVVSPMFAADTFALLEVTGSVADVPMGTPVKIEASGRCCNACQNVCDALCEGTRCADNRCCILTTDIDRTGDNGNFRLFVQAGRYHLVAVDADGNQWLLADNVDIAEKRALGKLQISKDRPYRPAPSRKQ